jgi:tetratricopeptide (TPR) repeat protein
MMWSGCPIVGERRSALLAALVLAMFAIPASLVAEGRTMPDVGSDCESVLGQAQTWLQAGNPQQAEAAIRSSLPTCQRTTQALALLGASLDEQGKNGDAQRIFLQAIIQNPQWASLRDNLGISYLHEHRDTEALAQFREAIRLDPHDRLAILNLAGCLIMRKRFKEALDTLDSHGSQASDDPEWFLAQTEALLGIGRNKQAVQSAERFVKVGGETPGIDFSLGLLFARYRQNKEAVAYFTHIPTDARDFATDFDLGLANEQLRNFDDAAAAFMAAMKIDPSQTQSYLELAMIDVEKGATDKALELLLKAHQVAMDRVDVTVELAELLIHTERLNDAQGLIDTEMRKHANAALLWKAEGDLFNRQNIDQKALSAYQESLKLEPRLIDSHIGLAEVYERMKQNSAARSEYAEVLRIAPECAAGNSGIGVLDLEDGHAAQAIPFLKEAFEEEPRDIDTGKSLANAYLQTGAYEMADQTLTSLLTVAPNNSQIHYLKGRTLIKLKRNADAQDEFKKAATVLNTPEGHPTQPKWFASSGCSAIKRDAIEKNFGSDPESQ